MCSHYQFCGLRVKEEPQFHIIQEPRYCYAEEFKFKDYDGKVNVSYLLPSTSPKSFWCDFLLYLHLMYSVVSPASAIFLATKDL